MLTVAMSSLSACVGATRNGPMKPLKSQSFQDRQERREERISRNPERRQFERRNDGLTWIPLFRDVDPMALRDALAACEVLELPTGTWLLTPGETNQTIYVVLSGSVVVHLDNGPGRDSTIAIAPGECVGELSAIDGKLVSALVMAQSNVRVLKVSSTVFWGDLMTLPSVARNLQIILSERLRSTNEIALRAQREQLELLHLRKELDVARQLQSSMLPLQRPLFADRLDIDVCGFMEPASSVGGDFFDAFFLHDRLLFICIGDVSGHGVAAALFMARIVGLLRLLVIGTDAPDLLLKELNDKLCVSNDANIFVTMFCGFLNVETGELMYSNGGHCAPILRSKTGIELLPIPRGPLIGAFADMNFGVMRITLNPGDVLFCYTDGVTEAQTRSGEEFSEKRCFPILGSASHLPLPEMLETFRIEVARFTESQVLQDDCTMLALRRPN